MTPPLFLLLGNQLLAPEHLQAARGAVIVMCEDEALCRAFRYHQQKLVLVLAAMRNHADVLREAGFALRYHHLDDARPLTLLEALDAAREATGATALHHFELDARHLEARLAGWASRAGLERRVLPNPQFLLDLAFYDRHLRGRRRPHLAAYYRAARLAQGILVDGRGEPRGGRWSFDAENRRRLPATYQPPPPPRASSARHVAAVSALVRQRFADHPGDLAPFQWPVTRADALAWLDDFLVQRFAGFGPYEDALSSRSWSIHHSLLAPLLNLGLLTPREVLDRALAHAAHHGTPLASVEGFVRQVLGWREFVRAVYRRHGAAEAAANFFGHTRGLAPSWYSGETGIPPLDAAIAGARTRGWNHHIERLMVIGNLMLLAGIAPRAAYRWFMEMYVDAYPWVMEPNVYGMALYSDGGLFATKPYACGANYLLKMGDHRRGPWCDTVDGLYWRFVATQRDFFATHPRLAVLPRTLDRLDGARRARLWAAAETFLARHTLPSPPAP